MKITLLVLIGIYQLITVAGRLSEKTTETTKVSVDKTHRKTKGIRITRDVFDDDPFIGFSKEDNGMRGEFLKALNRRSRFFVKSKFVSKTVPPNTARIVRESIEKDIPSKNVSDSKIEAPEVKKKPVLVKKPIPKFNEIEYEDEFEIRINKTPVRTADSIEHEDEDFNVDDYDFDVNHDEFIGRGKPLEPRMKFKLNKNYNELHLSPNPSVITQKEPVKQTEKLMRPVINLKKERSVNNVVKKVIDKTKVDDYYDDISSTVTPKSKTIDDYDSADENDDMRSKESSRGIGRSVRSPWDFRTYVDRFSDKTSMENNKLLSIL